MANSFLNLKKIVTKSDCRSCHIRRRLVPRALISFDGRRTFTWPLCSWRPRMLKLPCFWFIQNILELPYVTEFWFIHIESYWRQVSLFLYCKVFFLNACLRNEILVEIRNEWIQHRRCGTTKLANLIQSTCIFRVPYSRHEARKKNKFQCCKLTRASLRVHSYPRVKKYTLYLCQMCHSLCWNVQTLFHKMYDPRGDVATEKTTVNTGKFRVLICFFPLTSQPLEDWKVSPSDKGYANPWKQVRVVMTGHKQNPRWRSECRECAE